MATSLSFNTDSVPARDRAPQWREWVHQLFGGLDSDLYGDTEFDGRMAASHAGDVILTRLEANRHRVVKTRSLARGSETPYLKIVAPWHGAAQVLQQQRQAEARSGAWVIYDTTRDYEIANPERVEHLIVMLPKDRLEQRGVRLESGMARRLGASGISRVALETMRNTYLELPHMSEAAAKGAGELIVHLVELSLMELAGQETAATQREALRDRIRAYVARHLADPGLNVDAIARGLNCSRRLLYHAFAEEGDSIAAYIQRERLQACVRDLLADSNGGRPITDIALSWGFGNASHFSRVFRKHTGASASEFRSARAHGAALTSPQPWRLPS